MGTSRPVVLIAILSLFGGACSQDGVDTSPAITPPPSEQAFPTSSDTPSNATIDPADKDDLSEDESETSATALPNGDWDGIRYDIGQIEGLDRDANTITWDRWQPHPPFDGRDEPFHPSEFESEPIPYYHYDVTWVNENEATRTYVLARDVVLLEVDTDNAPEDCGSFATPGTKGTEIWIERSLDRLQALQVLGEVALTFNESGQVSLIRVGYGC